MFLNTLTEVYKIVGPGKGIVIPSDLMIDTGVLNTLMMKKSSHGIYDLAEVAAMLPQGDFRLTNGGYVISEGSASDESKIPLHEFGAIVRGDERIVNKFGGPQAYIKHNAASYAMGMVQGLETALIYSKVKGFNGLIDIAKANSKTTPSNASGTGTDYSSIIAVRYDPLLCHGLFDQKALAKGFFHPVVLNNGKAVIRDITEDGATTAKPVFEFRMTFEMALKIIGTQHVAVLSGLKDADNYRPTKKMLKALLTDIGARKSPSMCQLYMNGDIADLVDEILEDKLATIVSDKEYNLTLDNFKRVPLTISSAITNTEARVH
jgi:major capsid protein gp7